MIAIILAMPIAWGPCPGALGLGPGPGARGPGPGPCSGAQGAGNGPGFGPGASARGAGRGPGPGPGARAGAFKLLFEVFLDQKDFLHSPVWGREQLVVDPLPAAHRPPGCRQMRPEILVK